MKLLTTSAVVLAMASTAPAFAGNQTDVDQLLDNLQRALNSVTNLKRISDVDQSGANVGNSVFVTGSEDLDDVIQKAMSTKQVAKNSTYTRFGRTVRVDQLASNALNSVGQADGSDLDVNRINQVASATIQKAVNEIGSSKGAGGNVRNVSQGGANVANAVAADSIDEGVRQIFRDGDQMATNLIYGGWNGSGVKKAEQSAQNIANSISADHVHSSSLSIEVLQRAVGEQLATNDIEFNAGWSNDGVGLEDATQEALNAANMVSLDDGQNYGLTKQVARVTQTASNDAYNSSPQYGHHWWNTGGAMDVNQSATNIANLFSAVGGTASINGPNATEFTQISVSTQLANNGLFANGNVSNVIQSATNIANSISIGAAADDS